MKGKGRNYLYFGINPWRTIKQRSQHIAEGLARNNTVIFVNPISDWAGAALSSRPRLPALPLPFVMKPIFSSPGKSVVVVDLPVVPSPGGLFTEILNGACSVLIWSHLLEVLRRRDFYPDAVWLSHPSQAPFLRIVPRHAICCYDCMDDYAAMAGKARFREVTAKENDILSSADVVFASSVMLEEKCRKTSSNVVRVPNGVDIGCFGLKTLPSGIDQPAHRKKVVGFYGFLGFWLDYGLIIEIARRRPNWILGIIGPSLAPDVRDRLKSFPNIELPGEIPYEHLPEAVRQFDVCILPFKINNFAQSINPVKIYEYLATGKPVVSTDMVEVRELGSAIRIAGNTEEFINHLEEALAEKDAALAQERIRIARLNSWDERIRVIEREISSLLESGQTSTDQQTP